MRPSAILLAARMPAITRLAVTITDVDMAGAWLRKELAAPR